MDKELKRIRISKMYSEHNVFDPIPFYDGVNIILGEKYDENLVRGRKTNGVGKSMCIEFLDFCLLSDYDKSRIKKIPKDILDIDEIICLDLMIGKDEMTIKRTRKNHECPTIVRNGKNVTFQKLQDARDYLTELIFSDLHGELTPSYRNLLSILLRDERSEFTDIIKCHDLSKRIPDDYTAHLYLLYFSLDAYKKCIDITKQVEEIGTVLRKYKKELTQNGRKKMNDVKAELNALNDELNQMEKAIESFKTNETFDVMEKDLIEIESMLEQLRKQQKVVRYEYEKIREIPKPEKIDNVEIKLLYHNNLNF